MARAKWAEAIWNRPYLLLSMTSFFWATNIVLGRYIATSIPPGTLAAVRWIMAACLVLPFAWPHLRRDWPTIRPHIGLLSLLSFTGIAAYNTIAYYGLHFTEAINGLLMQSAAPLLIGLWSMILFRDRLTGAQIVGICASLFGVVVIITRGDLSSLIGVRLNPGDLLLLTALAGYAFYTALLRKRPPIHFLSFLGFTFAAGALMLIPVALAEYLAGLRIVWSPATFAVLAYVGVFPSFVAYLTFNRGVQIIGANRAGPFFHLIPVFGSAIAIAFLGERPALYHAVGYALIIGGIFVAQRGRRQPA